ncbi:Plakophilin-4 [Bagarius yarrelli]|uniref:Plakophilin-4 n=1 Tax=Bagarius yarrelli TaxID=175774 RepID=A0A556U013_BAGYA|nr:Plakophilin-4 [Bagarius yarrelli]
MSGQGKEAVLYTVSVRGESQTECPAKPPENVLQPIGSECNSETHQTLITFTHTIGSPRDALMPDINKLIQADGFRGTDSGGRIQADGYRQTDSGGRIQGDGFRQTDYSEMLSSEKSLPWRPADVSSSADAKCVREQLSLCSPEQSSLHERSVGNSRSSTQMNSYSDSGYQDASSYYSGREMGRTDVRLQHSYASSGPTVSSTLLRTSRAEGQASSQMSGGVSGAIPGRAMRRVSSVPSRTQSPAYSTGISPSRGSLRASLGTSYGSPIVTEPKPLPNIFSSSTLPNSQRASSPFSAQRNSPTTLRRVGSSTSASRTTSPYSGRLGSPLSVAGEEGQAPSGSSPVRTGMTAVPQHYGSTLPRALLHEGSDPYSTHSYEVYERMVSRPDSLTGLRASFSSQHSHHGADLRSTVSPDRHIGPIYEDRAFHGPLYRSPSHITHSPLYRSPSAVGNLQRSSSQRSNMTYQRSNNHTAVTYADPYRPGPYRPSDGTFTRHAISIEDGAIRSPSIDSIQKDPRLLKPLVMSHHDFLEHGERLHVQEPLMTLDSGCSDGRHSVCKSSGTAFGRFPVCRLGGIKHLVDLLDHKVVEVQRNACGALRNLVYGKATDDNKIAVRNAGGVPALLRLLRKTVDAEVREIITATVTNTVIIPHSGWSSSSYDDDHKLKFHSSLVLRNTTGCLRNLSSAGEEARKQMRCCEGLVDSLLYVIKACVSTADFDSKIVENCICTLRNLSYRLELEMPPSRLAETQEADGLLGSESPSKEADYSCWGRKRKKKRKSVQEEQWDGVGPIPGFSKSPKGAEMLWHPAVVKPYLTLLAESSNPATLEGSAGSLQNLSAGNWKFSAYIRAAVRKEKGLPILVELLRMDNDRVVCSVAIALRNMALDIRNKELIGKYAMRDLVNRLPGGSTNQLSDETVAAICCTLHEVASKNMENAKALADTGGIEKLVNITKGRGERYSMKVVKAAAQVLNTLWQYRDLRTIYKKLLYSGFSFYLLFNRDTLTAGSTTSSPAVLGIKEQRSDYQRTQPPMQYYNYQADGGVHKAPYTDETGRRGYEPYRTYMHSPQGYDEPYLEETVQYSTTDYPTQPHTLKATTNYVDFYSSTRRASFRTDQYPGSPDSWV